MSESIDRRDFLAQSAATVVTASTIAAASGRSAFGAANDEVRLGIIGCGGIMNFHVSRLVKRKMPVSFAWLCDVDPAQMEKIGAHADGYRKEPPRRTKRFEDVLDDPNVDAVIVATPHHWHAPITLRAILAGKDVYIEKPLSHVFNEGGAVIEAARRHKRVVQHGSQMRSSKVTELAGKMLADGAIGDVKISKAWNVQPRRVRQVVPDSAAPAGVDYDRWLGPAPKRPFNANRFHYNWRVYRDYGNGDIGDDGIHDIDMARWGLGVTAHPIRVTAHGSDVVHAGAAKGDREYPDNMMVAWEYPDNKVCIYEDRLFTPYGLHGYDSGNVFYGTEGYMIFSRRGYFQIHLGPKEEKGPSSPKEISGNRGRGYREHMQNFLDCIRSRDLDTNAPAEVAHLSCALVHLGDIAYRTRTVLEFDPEREIITNSDDANALLGKSYRAPYGLPTQA